jgi:predicted transcriptional regulator
MARVKQIKLTRAEAVDAIAALCNFEPRAECEVTAPEMAETWGCARVTAYQRLQRLVREGKVERRFAIVDSRIMVLYRVVGEVGRWPAS